MGRDQELIEAARGGNYPAVQRILTTKPRKPGPFASLRRAQGGISARDTSGYTALHYSSLNNHKEVVRLLLSYEASCNSVDAAGSSPLHLAAWAGHVEVVEILLKTGPSIPNVNLTNGDKETALHCAAQYGHLEVVRLLLDSGAEPNIKNSKEETALDLAAQYGRRETVSLLLETHPEMVGKFTAYGSMVYLHTPLHLASRNGHKAVVAELIKVGIDINVRTARGTALHEAALCGKVEVVKLLLDHHINTSLRDQSDQTVLDLMGDLQTSRTKEISSIILEHQVAGSALPHSPYDNISLTQSLDSVPALSSSESPRPRATSWQTREKRSAASVEELDKRISSFSSTSGFSDCTTSTLQGARSFESNFLSESELTMTGTLTRGDDTSISSASSTDSLSPVQAVQRPGSSVSQNTLTSSKPLTEKPRPPAKPAHIRPGLKPVQIPNVDDKLGLRPRKPPRRNLSISPVRTSVWDGEDPEGWKPTKRSTKAPVTTTSKSGVYSSKSGSKSFDELDDILYNEGNGDGGGGGRGGKSRTGSKKRNRRTLSSVSSTDVFNAKESNSYNSQNIPRESRHSCDEILSDTFQGLGRHCDQGLGQHCDQGLGRHGSDSSGNRVDCQRCILNSISNRSLNIHCDEDHGQNRFISQRQYKRKIRRESPKGGNIKYNTLDARTEKRLNGKLSTTSAVVVSKTTFKLRKNTFNSDLDSAGEDNYETSADLELMEIPLSPTHYNQPATPDHPPPTPWEAESAIHSVLSFLRSEYQPRSATIATDTEPWMLLSLDKSEWPDPNPVTEDKSTCTQLDRKVPIGRKLPAIPRDEKVYIATSPDSEDSGSNTSEVIFRHKPSPSATDESIYQSIDGDSESNRASQSSDKSSQSLSILSPFDEHEEWSKISQIIDSFGADIGKQTETGKDASTPNNSPVYDYPTLKKREKLTSTIEEWLSFISLDQYASNFEQNGYDNINYIGGGLLSKEDLLEIGITDPNDISVLTESLKHRNTKFYFDDEGKPVEMKENVEDWLTTIELTQYIANFRNNLLDDIERIKSIWDDELSSIAEIDKVGHRRRMLLSVAGTKGINERIGRVKAANKSPKKAAEMKLKITEPEDLPTSKLKKSISEKKPDKVDKPPKIEEKPVVKMSGQRLRKISGNAEEQSRQRSPDNVPLCSMHSAQRRHTSTSSTSEASSTERSTSSNRGQMDNSRSSSRTSQGETIKKGESNVGGKKLSLAEPVKKNSSSMVVESGTLTLGRRKKRAPLPPGETSPQLKIKSSSSKTSDEPASQTMSESRALSREETQAENHKKRPDEKVFKVMYHGNSLVQQFNGMESTREAIEKVKKSRDIIKRTGMPTTLVITDTEVKTTIFEGQEVLHNHALKNICCVVFDTENVGMFGYITTDINNMQRFSHVFSADTKDRAAEILSIMCSGFQQDALSYPEPPAQFGKASTSRKPAKPTTAKPTTAQADAAKSLQKASHKPTTPVTKPKGLSVASSRNKSDHLVTRMKNFFQGSETTKSSGVGGGSGGLSREAEGRRRRGGSMDNLIDSVGGEEITTNTRKKCSSIKNLSCLGPTRQKNEVKITSV